MKTAKNLFFAVQIEKTDKNNLRKEWRRNLFYFFESHETSYGVLTTVIKMHRQLSYVM